MRKNYSSLLLGFGIFGIAAAPTVSFAVSASAKTAAPAISPCPQSFSALGSSASSAGLDYTRWESLYPEHRFSKILDQAASGSTPRMEAIAALLSEAENKLKQAGVAYRRELGPHGSDRLMITPQSTSSQGRPALLNKLAAGLRKYGPETTLIYDPERIAFGLGGVRAFVEKTGGKMNVFMSHLAAQMADAKEAYLVHEVIHVKNFADELKKPNAFHSIALATDPAGLSFGKRTGKLPPLKAVFDGQYDRFMTLDELTTFRLNLRKNLRGILDEIDANGPNLIFHARELAATFQANAAVGSRAQDMATLSKSALLEFDRKGLVSPGASVSFKVDDVTYKAILKKTYSGAAGIGIEEVTGLLSRKKEVVSFDLAFSQQTNGTGTNPLPSMLSHLENLQAAGAENIELAMKVVPIISAFPPGSVLNPAQKAELKVKLQDVLNQIKFPKGYVVRPSG